jgi:hypothetical protein
VVAVDTRFQNSSDGRNRSISILPGPECPADFNLNSVVNSQDFFDFLGAFFAGTPAADFNRDGQTNSQDFFDFVAAFFAGC